MQNVSEIKHEKCYGCGACEGCPMEAVKLKEDKFGFRYPHVDKEKCTACGACLRGCPVLYKGNNQQGQTAYAARSRNQKVLSMSSSGGLGYEIGRWMIKKGGMVCGAAWDKDLLVKHVVINDERELDKIQGSKYVQSKCDGVYTEIVNLLKSGYPVLFVGTPCQVAAVKMAADGYEDYLYTMDIICHGVPNQKMFKEYLEMLGKKYSGKVIEFSFRDKQRGWGTVGKAKIKTDKKMFSLPIYKTEQSYYYYYLRGFLSRQSCYACPFASRERVGDITIGDYWGIESVHPEIKDIEKGISLMICNTEKGKKIIQELSGIEMVKTDLDKACRYNGQLVKPQGYDEKREELMQLYIDGGWKSIEERFDKNIGVRRYADRVKAMVPRWVVRKIKQNR